MLFSIVIHFTKENATVAVYCEFMEDWDVKALLLPKKKKIGWVGIFLYKSGAANLFLGILIQD